MLSIILMLLSFGGGAATPKLRPGGKCNLEDLKVYLDHGKDFPQRFRMHAGMFVTRSQYVEALHENEELSIPCAECYGTAYICGWGSCKMDCMSQDKICNKCLLDHKCSQACNKCTGFPYE